MLDRIYKDYFEWMVDLVCDGRFPRGVSYRKLLGYLHDTEFTFIIDRDVNRAEDGINLRRKYGLHNDCPEAEDILYGPCSVLEMILALAIRCEETIMDDTAYGDRTGQWFWGMITNLGLGRMTDDYFDIYHVESVVERFLDREYEADGRGGLFTIEDAPRDLRDVEIWYQLNWYLNKLA